MAGAKKASIIFFCDGVCQATSPGKLKAGTAVFLVSDGVAVKLDFHDKSPFVSGVKKINLAANAVRKETIGSTADEFSYSLNCGSSCPKQDDEPSVIVIL